MAFITICYMHIDLFALQHIEGRPGKYRTYDDIWELRDFYPHLFIKSNNPHESLYIWWYTTLLFEASLIGSRNSEIWTRDLSVQILVRHSTIWATVLRSR